MNRDNHFEHVMSIDCWGCSTSIIPTPVREPGLSQSSNLYITCDAVVDSMNECVTVGNIYDGRAIWWVNKGCKRQRLGKPPLDRGELAEQKETSRRCVIRKRKQLPRCPITTTMDKRIHEENHCDVHPEEVIYEESQNAVHTEEATHERNQNAVHTEWVIYEENQGDVHTERVIHERSQGDVHKERHMQKGSQGTRHRMRDGPYDPGIVTHKLADRDWIHQRNTRIWRQGITHTEWDIYDGSKDTVHTKQVKYEMSPGDVHTEGVLHERNQGIVHTAGVIHERSQGDVHTEGVIHERSQGDVNTEGVINEGNHKAM